MQDGLAQRGPGTQVRGRLVLVLYALDSTDIPGAWRIQLIGNQLRLYRAPVLGDVSPDATAFSELPSPPADGSNKFKISQIYKIEIENDLPDETGPLFILETLPDSSSLTCKNWSSKEGFREFEFEGIFSAVLAESVDGIWFFRGKVEGGLKWDRFHFSAKHTVDLSPAGGTADFRPDLFHKTHLADVLLAASEAKETEMPYQANSWKISVKNYNNAGFMGSRPCEDFFGFKLRGSSFVRVWLDMAKVEWLDKTKDAKHQKRIFLTPQLRAEFEAAIEEEKPEFLDIRGYGAAARNPAAEIAIALGLPNDNKLMYRLDTAEAEQMRMVARPAGTLRIGPASSGTPMSAWRPGTRYSPSRRITFEFRHLPARFFVESWNQIVRQFNFALNSTQRGNSVSMLPLFVLPAKGAEGGWTIYYNLMDRSGKEAMAGKYKLMNQGVTDDDRTMRTASLHSMHPDVGRRCDLVANFPQLNGIWKPGAIGNMAVPIAGTEEQAAWKLEDTERGLRFNLAAAIYAKPDPRSLPLEPRIRFGSFDLFLHEDQTPLKEEQLAGLRARLDRSAGGHIVVETTLSFAMRSWSPGGQDADRALEYAPLHYSSGANDARCESGFVDVPSKSPRTNLNIGQEWEQMFARELPILIYKAAAVSKKGNAHYLLDTTETNYDQYSHSLDLKVRVNDAEHLDGSVDACAPNKPEDLETVFVLARSPFLAAKIAFKPLAASQTNDTVIASWTNRSDQNAGWQLRFNDTKQSPVCLTLPSQTMGESMLRGKDPADGDTDEKFAEYNLGPNATIAMDVNAEGTAYTAVPWNLQELTSKPNLAPAIKHMDYELLYGLSCNYKAPFLRLVELFGRIGAIPGRPKTELAWNNRSSAYQEQVNAYQKWQYEWAWIYRRYLNRLAIFETTIYGSNPDSPPAVLKNPALSCWFRLPDASNMKPPFTLDQTDVQNKPTLDRLKLGEMGGGATWGFASKNVYIASVLDPSRQFSRTSSSAELSEFAFSSLGMYGKQMAGFQGDLTKVYGDAHQGRVYRYKVERKGRIAVFWNVAKHVVVFERRVAPSRQFEETQGTKDRMLGAPVLRIVQEYVELVNERQDFPHPDNGGGSTADPAALAARRGCVTGIQFSPGARFNVSSEWGSDVGKYGWKIPLWKPGASPADSYPKPRFDLRMSPQDKAAKETELQRFARPEQVYFFTLTKMGKNDEDPDPDPQKWPPIEGVDYSDFPEPKPLTDFENGDSRQFTAPDRAQPVGFGSCTFELEPAATPVNLMGSRAPAPMAVQLRSVTLGRCRGTDADLPKAPVGNPSVLDIAGLQRSVEGKLQAIFATLLKEFPVNKVFQPGLRDRILRDIWPGVDARFTALKDEVAATQNKTDAHIGSLKTTIERSETLAGKTVLDRISAEVGEAKGRADAQIRRIQNAPGRIGEQGTQVIHDFGAEISEKLLLCGSLPGRYTRFMIQVADRIASYSAEAEIEINDALERLQRVADAPGAKIEDCRRAATVEIDRLARMENQVLSQTRDWMPPEIPSAATKLQAELQNYLGVASALAKILLDPPLKAPSEFKAQFARIQSGPLQTLKNPTQMVDIFNRYSKQNIAAVNFNQLVQRAQATLKSTTTGLVSAWQMAVDTAAQKTFTDTAGISAAVKDLSEAVTSVTGVVQVELGKLTKQAFDQADKAGELFSAGAALIQAEIQAGRDRAFALFQQAATEAGELEAQIQKCRDEAIGKARDWCDRSVGPLMAEVRANTPGMFQAGDTAMRLVKAFGDPPKTAQMAFERSDAGYYFKQAAPGVDLSPVMGVLNQGAAVVDALKPLGLNLPCAGITDQIIPASLKNFDLNQIFGNFAGIDLKHLLDGFKLPGDVNGDKIKVTHEIDQRQKRAYARATVNFDIDKTAVILDFGPIRLELPKATFKAFMEMSAGVDGSQSRQANGSLKGDWRLVLAGTTILTLKDAELLFNDSGSLQYKIDPSKIELPEIMAFVTEKLAPFLDSTSGLSFGAVPGGYRCLLDLPLPDLQGATSGVTGLHLGASLALLFDDGFRIQVGCSLGRKEAPFNVAFFVIGGGGYLETTLTYTPDKGTIVYGVDLAVTASASIAIALGPIHGGVFIYLGITAHFSTEGHSNSFGVVYIIRGEVCIAGIVTAFVSLSLNANYSAESGTLTGIGRLVVRIKICWCFTFEIDQSVTYTLKNGEAKKSSEIQQQPVYLASLGDPGQFVRHQPPRRPFPSMGGPALFVPARADREFLKPETAADRYVNMLV